MLLHRLLAAFGLFTALYACGGGKPTDRSSHDAPTDSVASGPVAAATGPVTVDPHCEEYCKRLKACPGVAPIPFQDTNHEGCVKACSRGYDKPDDAGSNNFLITRDVNCTVNPDQVDCELIQQCHDPAGTHDVACLKVHVGGRCQADDDCCPDSAGNPLVCSHTGRCWPTR